MSPVEREQILAIALDDYRVRQTRGDRPAPEDYADGLDREDYEEFLTMLDVQTMLDDLLEPPREMRLPRAFGPYRLLRVVGRGAAGIVYEAENLALGRREAVKVLQAGPDAERALLERFRQEAHVLASVRHPNIVEIYGAGQEEGHPYYSMALLEGTPLSAVIRAKDRPDPRVVCRGLAEVADALEWLHERGILHRDVKPQNIVVAADGRMVLADFGLARTLTSPRLTVTGQVPGTPLYMSPEQILGRIEDIDRRSDVYGLGATLYEALSGQPILPHEDWRVLFRSRLNERPEALRRVAPEVPADCAAIAMKAVEPKPADRYPTAAAMRDDLRAVAAGERPQGRPVSALRRGMRQVRRFWIPAAAVLLLGLVGFQWASNRPGRLIAPADVAGVVLMVDGTAQGEVPIEISLAPGEYEVSLQYPGCELEVRQIRLGPGETHHFWPPPGPVKDANDPQAFDAVSAAGGIETAPPERHSGDRHARIDAPNRVVFPAGPVRLGDLDRYRLEIGMDEPPAETRLVFRRGEEILHEEPFHSQTIHPEERPIPVEVLAALRVGDFVSWGLEVPEGETAAGQDLLQRFHVVAGEGVDEVLARVDQVAVRQIPALRAALRARALLAQDLPLAAFREVAGVVDPEAPAASGIAPWIQYLEALKRMGLENRTVLWFDGYTALWNHAFSREVVEDWYGDTGR